MSTYTIQTKCENCGAVGMYTIEKGVRAERIKCNNCGCAGTLRQYDTHIFTTSEVVINEDSESVATTVEISTSNEKEF